MFYLEKTRFKRNTIAVVKDLKGNHVEERLGLLNLFNQVLAGGGGGLTTKARVEGLDMITGKLTQSCPETSWAAHVSGEFQALERTVFQD